MVYRDDLGSKYAKNGHARALRNKQQRARKQRELERAARVRVGGAAAPAEAAPDPSSALEAVPASASAAAATVAYMTAEVILQELPYTTRTGRMYSSGNGENSP